MAYHLPMNLIILSLHGLLVNGLLNNWQISAITLSGNLWTQWDIMIKKIIMGECSSWWKASYSSFLTASNQFFKKCLESESFHWQMTTS